LLGYAACTPASPANLVLRPVLMQAPLYVNVAAIQASAAGRGRAGGPWPPWIFIHGTNIVEVLKSGIFGVFFAIFWSFLLFFGLFFHCPPPWKFFCRRPWLQRWRTVCYLHEICRSGIWTLVFTHKGTRVKQSYIRPSRRFSKLTWNCFQKSQWFWKNFCYFVFFLVLKQHLPNNFCRPVCAK